MADGGRFDGKDWGSNETQGAFNDRVGHARRSSTGKRPPRIAFAGEEYGFGYLATEGFVRTARARYTNHVYPIIDGGATAGKNFTLDQDNINLRAEDDFDFAATEHRLPLRSKEQALMAVKAGTADYALVPFYDPNFGYDYETLRALGNLVGIMGVEQYHAGDNMCLAVHESQVLELAQSAHPGSALSAVLKHDRRSWGDHEKTRFERNMDVQGQGESFRAGLAIDHATQLALRDRLEMVFSGPEAMRRCKSKLDGLRSIGVELAETPRAIEPHRELARRARASLNTSRQINTFFDPRSGEAHYVSSMTGESQQRTQLFGVVLPFTVAMMSSDYVIVDPDFDDNPVLDTRFLVVHRNPDVSRFEDAYRTTDAKARYWRKRVYDVLAKAEAADRLKPKDEETRGLRMIIRFNRTDQAATTADVENYLRNYGVPFNVIRIDEDSEASKAAPIAMDIEFSIAHGDFHRFRHPFRRNIQGSVISGALKKAFQRWKGRGVQVLAVMPYTRAQLPRQKPRWWFAAIVAQQKDFWETMFIRITRVFFLPLMALLLGSLGLAFWTIWKMFNGG
ncbi:MAG: hypothetical protein AAGH42_03345 [Pseudomonadota bacterium]